MYKKGEVKELKVLMHAMQEGTWGICPRVYGGRVSARLIG